MTGPARQSVRVLKIAQLQPNPANVRESLGDLAELVASVREHGIVEPLVVTESLDPGCYVVLAGHRRLEAARRAGHTSVPCVIRHDLDEPADQLVIMLVENCQRSDLHPVDRAHAYGALRNHGLTLTEIAKRTGSHVSTVSYYLSLLDLDEQSLADVRSGRVPLTIAREAVVRTRKAERRRQRIPERGRPVVADPHHFTKRHLLASKVSTACLHSTRPKVGGVGCGQCWEDAIRGDERERDGAA